ncbi:hypothetical protein REPUB_Repub18cG0133300 [Reevesia pubescens]
MAAGFKAKQPSEAAEKAKKPRMGNAERSAYFARREAVKVLWSVLQGDVHLPIIKDVLEIANILNSRWKGQEELVYIITYDILFGQEISFIGDAEKFLVQRKISLQSALPRILVRKKVKCIVLGFVEPSSDVSKPRYVRVNALKLDVDSALVELGKQYMVQKDDLVPDLLKLPAKIGKSTMVAAVLDPEPGWEVLDACAAPGNKTVHLAALMRGKGKVIACELNKERIKRLEDYLVQTFVIVLLVSVCRHLWWYAVLNWVVDIKVMHGDFLSLDPTNPLYSKISFNPTVLFLICSLNQILLDPSCSVSGTVTDRLDHLLPSYAAGQAANIDETERLNKPASFQRKH